MNLKFSKFILLISLLGIAVQVFAQHNKEEKDRFGEVKFRKWSFSIHGGALNAATLFSGKDKDFRTNKFTTGFGAYVKRQILPSFGVQAEVLKGTVKGMEAASGIDGNGNFSYAYSGNSDFLTKIEYAASLSLVLNLANISINKENGVFAPYVKGGGGYMSSGVTTRGTPDEITDQGHYSRNWFFPVGLGFKLSVAKGINIDLGYDVHFIKSDVFDGFIIGGYDRISYAHGGLEFAIGNPDKPQLQNYSALANLKKLTEEESKSLQRALSTAEENAKRDREQYARDMADDDNDGVANKFDKCPNTPSGTTVDVTGCPVRVAKENAKDSYNTATTPKTEKKESIPVRKTVTEADRKVVTSAIANLEFDLGRAIIRPKSYGALNRVAELMIQKNFDLTLEGHTDNVGPREVNIYLSKRRAEAVKAYLIAQGVNQTKIEAIGYGPDRPVVSNNTPAGRQENRRVEFNLY